MQIYILRCDVVWSSGTFCQWPYLSRPEDHDDMFISALTPRELNVAVRRTKPPHLVVYTLLSGILAEINFQL